MDKFINRAVNLAVLVASVAIIYHVARTAYVDRAQTRPVSIAVGTTLADSDQLKFRAARRTLVLVTSSKCPYCRASMPFYKSLTAAAHAAGVRVVGIAAEEVGVHREFLNVNGLYVDDVTSVRDIGIHVSGTPTLILVDSHGIVRASWEGQLSPNKESQTLRLVVSRD